MPIKDKNKIKSDTRGKMLYDIETGELQDIEYYSTKNISVKKKPFMRLFQNKTLKKEIYKNLGDYTKYILLISDYIDYDNIINFALFQQDYVITDPMLSKIRKRLVENGIIKKEGKIWYANPVVYCKGGDISSKLWNIFSEENERIYKITKI